MGLSWRKPNKSTPDQEPEEISKRKEEADIPEWVKEEVLVNRECHLRFYGCVDKEFLEDSLGNTESPRKLISISNLFE